MSELELRKRELVAESEVYRELLRIELKNVQVLGTRTFRHARSYRNALPLIMGIPLLTRGLFRKKQKEREREKEQPSWKKFAGAAMLGWDAYRSFKGALRENYRRRRHREQGNGSRIHI